MNDIKQVTLSVRMSEAEHRRLQKLAKMHNQSMAAWVRYRIIEAPIQGLPGRMALVDDE